jgi:uncharacterized protein YbaR (Trm112 family)
MGWTNTKVTKPIPKEVQKIVTPISDFVSAVQTPLDVISGLLDVAQAFYIGATDPLKPLAGSLLSEVDGFLNNFFATDLYSLTITPYTPEGRRSYDLITGVPFLCPQEAIKLAQESFDDKGDSSRPQFTSKAGVAGFGFLVIGESANELARLMNLLDSIFNIPEFRTAAGKIEQHLDDAVIRSTAPDWKRYNLAAFSEFAFLKQKLSELAEIVRGYLTTADDAINDLIDTIELKVAVIQSILEDLDYFLNRLGKANNIWFWRVPSTLGGNQKLKKELEIKLNSCLCEDTFSAIQLYVAGGASTASLSAVDSIIDSIT